MSTQTYPDTHHGISANTIFGFWIYLLTDCIMFATFFAVYAVLQGSRPACELFSLPFALAETLILLTSSFTCGVAMTFTPKLKPMVAFFSLAFLLGVIFIWMGLSEFGHLIAEGYTWQSNAFFSSYFTLVGLHGLHIIIGLLLMIVFVAQLIHRGLTAAVLRRLTCLRMYWHFLYLIWIFTFTLVYLFGAT